MGAQWLRATKKRGRADAPEADLDAAAAAATAGRFGAMGAASAEGRCRQCSGKRASVASVVKKGERMDMTGRPGHVMA